MREILVVTPVYNDWAALASLARALEAIGSAQALHIRILAVDDGSTAPGGENLPGNTQVVRLARNLGHQRAIAVGLAVAQTMRLDAPVVVMDCDGEDRPEDIPALLAEYDHRPGSIVFARRAKRSEGGLFRAFYLFFKLIFRLLTGKSITFGNFCVIPPASLERIVYLQEIWNHFAAGVMRSGLIWVTIPTERGKRYAGRSHMNLVSLVLHGLSAISVYIEVVYVRLMFAALALMGLDVAGFLLIVYIRFFTPLAIPGWATNVAIGLTVIMVQALLFLGLMSFVVLSYRSAKMFIPIVDYKDFVLGAKGPAK
jgi:glycosyltransferase involved in cell wall biosynthesis